MIKKRRLDLKEKQRQLIDMDFDRKGKSDMLQFINQFMLEKTLLHEASNGRKMDSSRERQAFRIDSDKRNIKHIYKAF